MDTSALIAYFNVDVRYHGEAFEVMEKIGEGEIPLTRFYSTDFVFDETVTFIECVLGDHGLAVKVGEALQTSPFTITVRIDQDLFIKAWDFFRDNKGYSFTDCTSFNVMERYGVTHAFTFDRHFRHAGFKTIP